jgi:hypothetical protein
MKSKETQIRASYNDAHTNANVGSLDRLARLVLASTLIVIPLTGVEPTEANVVMLLAAIPLMSSAIMAWDPLYALAKLRTATLRSQPPTERGAQTPYFDGANVGMVDRFARFGLAAALLSVTLLGSADAAVLSYTALAAIPIAMTGIMGWDPFYQIFGARTATLPATSVTAYQSRKASVPFTVFDAETAAGTVTRQIA